MSTRSNATSFCIPDFCADAASLDLSHRDRESDFGVGTQCVPGSILYPCTRAHRLTTQGPGPTYFKAVPESEQLVGYAKSQANSLRSFYGTCNVSKNNGPFVVALQQESPTFFICSDGTVYSWYCRTNSIDHIAAQRSFSASTQQGTVGEQRPASRTRGGGDLAAPRADGP